MRRGSARPQVRNPIHPERSALLVVGVVAEAGACKELAWGVITRVEPRLRHLIQLSGGSLPMPRLHRASRGSEQLGAAIRSADRIALLAAIHGGRGLGSLTAWHHTVQPPASPTSGGIRALSTLSFTAPVRQLGLYHLPLWLEDELPAGGVDFLGIDVPPNAGPEESASLRRQMPLMVSAVTGVLWRIVRQIGESDRGLRQAA